MAQRYMHHGQMLSTIRDNVMKPAVFTAGFLFAQKVLKQVGKIPTESY